MHKLFVVIGFVGLSFVAHPALAERSLPNTSSGDLKKKCDKAGGTYGTTRGSYYCETKTVIVECTNRDQKCISVTKHHSGGKPGAGLNKGFGVGASRTSGYVAPGTINGQGTTMRDPSSSTSGTRGQVAPGKTQGSILREPSAREFSPSGGAAGGTSLKIRQGADAVMGGAINRIAR